MRRILHGNADHVGQIGGKVGCAGVDGVSAEDDEGKDPEKRTFKQIKNDGEVELVFRAGFDFAVLDIGNFLNVCGFARKYGRTFPSARFCCW